MLQIHSQYDIKAYIKGRMEVVIRSVERNVASNGCLYTNNRRIFSPLSEMKVP